MAGDGSRPRTGEDPPPEASTAPSLRAGALAFAATALVSFAVPDVDLGPFDAVNPNRLVRIAAAILGIGLVGELANRRFGARHGLLVSGFVAGFLSSTATIAAMGARAKDDPASLPASVAGGMASNVATILEYGLILAAVDPALPVVLARPLGLALVVTVAVTAWFARAGTHPEGPATTLPSFRVAPAFVVALGSAVVSIGAAALESRFGGRGAVLASTIAGLVDAHATAAGVGTLHHGGHLPRLSAEIAIAAALSSNSCTKLALAVLPGSAPYARRVGAGVLAMVAAAWLGIALDLAF